MLSASAFGTVSTLIIPDITKPSLIIVYCWARFKFSNYNILCFSKEEVLLEGEEEDDEEDEGVEQEEDEEDEGDEGDEVEPEEGDTPAN